MAPPVIIIATVIGTRIETGRAIEIGRGRGIGSVLQGQGHLIAVGVLGREKPIGSAAVEGADPDHPHHVVEEGGENPGPGQAGAGMIEVEEVGGLIGPVSRWTTGTVGLLLPAMAGAMG